MRKKAFTLIELIAVLVILAILALIVTPLVMSIIKKARVSADKRSIDAYGRSIELAIANYLLDNGDFPTSINDLNIEYSGDQVVCETTQLNSDSSVYLAGCTVAGRSVEEYTYGKEETITYNAYEIGDEVTYNNVDYYVIKDSSSKDNTVTLLKAEPLSYEEVQMYSAGTGAQTNDHGGIYYHSSGNDYSTSYVKIVVDAWAQDKVPNGLQEARLILLEDLFTNLGFDESAKQCTGSCWYNKPNDLPTWLYDSNYNYWTGSPYNDSSIEVWSISRDGNIDCVVDYHGNVVRPVITIYKSVLN